MVNSISAAAAYANAGQTGQITAPMEARDQAGKSGFAELLQQTGTDAMDAISHGEDVSMQALAGNADINELVLAVNQAEMSLQTLVTLRDKVIEAYQEVARMPI